MRVTLLRTGGFSGIRIAATVDTDSLSAEEAAKVREMVQSAGLLDAEPESGSLTGHPDQHGYRVTVAEGGNTNTVSVAEPDVTPELRPLLDLLIAEAKKAQRRGSR